MSTPTELTPEALIVLDEFLNLPMPSGPVRCPYFTNERQRTRGGLRVQVGKGSSEEIVEEAKLVALKNKVNLSKLTPESTSRFLVDHNLGIDCSGLAYYILEAESLARRFGHLTNQLTFPRPNNILSYLRSFFIKRPIENTSVAVLADALNSKPIDLASAQAGDFFIINKYTRQTGTPRNHIMVIISTKDGKIAVANSVALPEDGRYGHGVRIEYVDPTNPPGELRRLSWL